MPFELGHQYAFKHGGRFTPEYKVWASIKFRCYNKNSEQYRNYGGRGIIMCDEWFNSFPAFLASMGPRPSPKHSIDRIDNNGNYEPDNCRWATLEEQANNMRTNHHLTFNGETMTITAWSKKLGVTKQAIYRRLLYGWSIERTLSEGKHGKQKEEEE